MPEGRGPAGKVAAGFEPAMHQTIKFGRGARTSDSSTAPRGPVARIAITGLARRIATGTVRSAGYSNLPDLGMKERRMSRSSRFLSVSLSFSARAARVISRAIAKFFSRFS
jgi:hypothetical protein